MTIKGQRIDDNERFLCNKKELFTLFSEFDIDIYLKKKDLSEVGKMKNADYYYKKRPNYSKGGYEDLVCSLFSYFFEGQKKSSLFIYSIAKEDYGKEIHQEFISAVLPKLISEYIKNETDFIKRVNIFLKQHEFVFSEQRTL